MPEHLLWLAASVVIGGAAGFIVSALMPSGRRRGPHRRWWRRHPPGRAGRSLERSAPAPLADAVTETVLYIPALPVPEGEEWTPTASARRSISN
ncbi:hypothetical protein ACH4FX_12285 [Streptomyces sp. NPDC018019]|uniref:hypothetical protein n=1 Tax=Streptomyces sp. NPDC018019 TaxID=3365030 RepID=UPI0037A7EB74